MSSTAMQKTRDIIEALNYAITGAHALAKKIQPQESNGQRLARLRRDKGITQKELADLLGVTQSVVSDYENGGLRLHGELIVELCGLLGCSADELLGLSKATQGNTALKNRRLYRRVQQIDQLPKRDQDALLRTIDAFLSKAS